MLSLKSSYLKLYIGCMFSGKTTSLLNEISKYKVLTDEIITVNHIFDKHRNNDNINQFKTHNNKTYPAIMISQLEELKEMSKYTTSKIVIIDEGQFFMDLYDFIKYELETTNKIFIVGGLSGDYKMEPIGDIARLIPLADEINKLNAYCIRCNDGTVASFTKRINDSSDQVIIGSDDIYTSVCRYHFLNNF